MNTKGSDWILCPSKTYPGFLYYFNVLSGETVWSSHCLPQSSQQDGTPSTLERNLVHSRITKTDEFGNSEFPKYINNRDHAISRQFQLKSPKLKTLTKRYEPIRSPILKSFGFSRNAQINQKQDIRSQGSQEIFLESEETLGADDLRWTIMMKKIQNSAVPQTSQMQTKDEQKAVVTPNRKVKFFIDMTDEESLKLNGYIGNDDAGTAPSRLVILNQNCSPLRSVQNEDAEDHLFLQNTSTFDPVTLSQSLQNGLHSLRTNSFRDSNTMNETCDGLTRLNLNEQLYMRYKIFSSVETKLSTLSTKYDNLQDHIMTGRIEEWICCYLQIMEQFLHEIFQVTNATKFEPPCWLIQGLKRFKEIFSHHKPVCAITDLLLSMCGYCVKNGIVRTNIKPNQFIKLLCGGILLLEEFVKFTRGVDVLAYKDMLQQLIESIRNPSIVSDMQAIDVGYSRDVRYHTKQPHDYLHCKSQGGVINVSPTFGVSQKQPTDKYVSNVKDSDGVLQASDDVLTDRYDTEMNFANHRDSLMNINILQVDTDMQNTNNIEQIIDFTENDSFHINDHEDQDNRNVDDTRLARTASILTRDCNDVNDAFKQGKTGRKDNINHDRRNLCGVLQGNDNGINDAVNIDLGNGNVNRDKTDVERNSVDGADVIDIIRTMVNTTRKALEALKVNCENSYNELCKGDLTEGRKKYLREATNQALAMVTAMLIELNGITKRDESNDSPMQRMLGDQGDVYRICMKNCLSQTLIAESTLKYILQAIDEG